MAPKALIDYDEAVYALACYFAVAGPPGITEHNKAKSILWGCLAPEDQTRRVLR